ncbi:MAG: class I SAM-dependent methyltransferase family protein [bacterium]
MDNGFNIITDRDVSLKYETKKWPYVLILPLIWILTVWVMLKKKVLAVFKIKPKINTFWFDGLSIPCREIKNGAASWRALDIIYNYQPNNKKGIRDKVSDFWIGMINAQAVRNRLRLVKREVVKAIRSAAQKKEEVCIFSIASGSAQAILESMQEVEKDGIKTKAVLLDFDQTALEYSKKMAEKFGLKDRITFVRKCSRDLEKALNGNIPDIVEMIGFLDYRPHDKAVQLIKKIYKIVPSGGIFLTANMIPNSEQFFMKSVIDWSMIYRDPKELGLIVTKGGFNPKKIQILCEPLKLHAVAICQKT